MEAARPLREDRWREVYEDADATKDSRAHTATCTRRSTSKLEWSEWRDAGWSLSHATTNDATAYWYDVAATACELQHGTATPPTRPLWKCAAISVLIGQCCG
jgi:hypothetical protein